MADIRLTDGNDSYSYARGSVDDRVLGLGGDDQLTVTSGYSATGYGTVTLDGGAGNDTLVADSYATILIGGAGTDVAQLPLYNGGLSLTTDAQGRYVIGYSYSPAIGYTIDPSTETVRFQFSYYSYYDYTRVPNDIAYADLPKFVGANILTADIANTTPQHLVGTAARVDTAYFNGNPYDYTYTQLPGFTDPVTGAARAGDIVLTAVNGSGIYTIGSNVDYVHFLYGQTLAFADLPGAIKAGTPAPVADQTISASYGDFHIYVGGAGTDTLVMNGALKDFTVKAITAYAADAPETATSRGQAVNGFELIATNGSGVYVVDPSIERVSFVGDGVVNYADLAGRVAPAPAGTTTDTLHLAVAGAGYGPVVFGGDGFNDRALVTFDAGYPGSLSRDAAGDFVLSSAYDYYGNNETVVLKQSIETVQLYPGGPVFALADLPRYVSGDPTFTAGTAADDILYNAPSGDQYLVGGAGRDTAYLTGNVNDYAIRAVTQAATATTPAISGYELVSLNGSGNIYIDGSTETVHLQNGDFFTFVDLPTFVTRTAAQNGIGTAGDDAFLQALSGDQSFVGGAGNDTLFLRGNVQDYSFEAVNRAATATTPAAQGVILHALNHSGDLFVDASVEAVHFSNGLFSSYAGLQTFVADHPFG